MITQIITYLILLLPILAYSGDLDFDTSLVEKVTFNVRTKHPCSYWRDRYCVSQKSDVQKVITSFLRAELSDKPSGLHDTVIAFVTKDKNNYSTFHYYGMPKGQPDSILSYYAGLAVKRPNWLVWVLNSDRFDLFDTTLNYLKANYNVDSTYSNKLELTGHRIKFKTKDFINMNDEYKFTNLLDSISKKSRCVFPKDRGTTQLRFLNGNTDYIPKADIYFPCGNVYDLAEVLKYLHAIEGIEIEKVEIKNYFEIKFWFEKNQYQGDLAEVKANMRAAGIAFSEINGFFED